MKSHPLLILLLALFTLQTVVHSQTDTASFSIGDKAPVFTGINQYGQSINSLDLLKKGPVVLLFYRGFWCPLCNKHLARLQDSLQMIHKKGATLVAITPEKPENIEKTIKKSGATFHILSDPHLEIMNTYGVHYQLKSSTHTLYQLAGINLTEINGSNDTSLPVPATFVIDPNGHIRYLHYNPDYKKRASVKTILQHL